MSAYIEMSTEPRHIVLTCGDRDHELAKRIPGGRFHKPVWVFPASFGTCLAARAEFGARLEVGPALNEWAGQYLDWRAQALERPFSAEYGSVFQATNGDRERTHQVWGGDLLAYLGRGALLDPMRLGKTITVLRALRLRKISRFLVVAPNTATTKWRREIEKWFPDAGPAVIVRGTPTQKRRLIEESSGPVVVNWEAIRSLGRLERYGDLELTEKQRTRGPLNLAGFEAVVADEAHRMVDPHSQQTRAMWALLDDVEIKYLLTGTILTTSPEDLWSPMRGIAPHEYPVRSHFISRYTLSGRGQYGFEVWGWNPATSEELHTFLDPRIVRRTWESVGVEVPPTLPPEIRPVYMEAGQAKAYAALKKELALAEGDQLLLVQNPLELATRLIQAAGATPVLGKKMRKFEDEEREITTVEALKMPSCKVDALLDILEELAGDSVVVFAESKLLINLVEEQLTKAKFSVVRITGDEGPGLRQENIDAFQDGRAQVVLCTYAAGSEAITLDRANVVVRLQRPRSMVQFQQAAARTLGMSKQDPTQVIDVFTEQSIESRVWDQNEVKEGYLAELLRDELR